MERKYTKQQINDLRRVMDGNKEEMIPLLKYIRPKSQILNGLSRYLPAVFLKLKLDSKTVVLDLACGQGGVSIGLADKYGVNVVGYDIVPEYIQYAKELAMEKNVGHLCRFQIGDIRNIVKKKNICDVLLWFAPPRVFGKTKSTIKALRNSVKNNGFIVVGDAYLLPGVKAFGQFKNYENLKGTDKDFVFYGDTIIYFRDFKGALWREDYALTKRLYGAAIKKAKSTGEKEVLQRAIKNLGEAEKKDAKNLGMAVWVIKVKK